MNKNYISAEQFLRQSEKVKKTLLNWWQPQIGDLFENSILSGIGAISQTQFIAKNCINPLFNETQLRSFIEKKYNCPFDLRIEGKSSDDAKWIYQITLYSYEDGFEAMDFYPIEANDLLEAYWDVVCKIAEESEVKQL